MVALTHHDRLADRNADTIWLYGARANELSACMMRRAKMSIMSTVVETAAGGDVGRRWGRGQIYTPPSQ